MDITKEGAAVRCLASLAEESGAEMAEKLAPALWAGAEVQLVLSGVRDFDMLQKIVASTRAADGVNNVLTRTFSPEETVLTVELFGGNAQTLAAHLEARAKPRMQIQEVVAYRIKAAIGLEGTGK